jgi:hypothetical protein
MPDDLDLVDGAFVVTECQHERLDHMLPHAGRLEFARPTVRAATGQRMSTAVDLL